MGWGSLLGNLAKGFAEGYIEKRGVDGTLKDVGDLASGVKNFFSSNNNEITWDDITNHVTDLVNEDKYAEALNDFDAYYQEYESGTADGAYYYWRALILVNWMESPTLDADTFKDVNQALSEAITEGMEFRDSELKAELKEIARRQIDARQMFMNLEKWSEAMNRFDELLQDGKPHDALKILDQHYDKVESGVHDYFYFSRKWKAVANISCIEDDKSDSFLKGIYDDLKSCYDGMRGQDNLDDDKQKDISDCREVLDMVFQTMINNQCNELLSRGDFKGAEKTATNELKYSHPHAYHNVICRIKSSYVEYLVDNKETSVDKIEPALKDAEEALSVVTMDEKDENVKRARIEVVTKRLDKGRDYVSSLKGTAVSEAHADNGSEAEKEYIAELKACLDDDGVISNRERRLLDKLRKSLGISEERASQLEADMMNHNSLSDEENEYLEEYRACIANDGVISEKERRLLDRLKKVLGISEQRATELESIASNK